MQGHSFHRGFPWRVLLSRPVKQCNFAHKVSHTDSTPQPRDKGVGSMVDARKDDLVRVAEFRKHVVEEKVIR